MDDHFGLLTDADYSGNVTAVQLNRWNQVIRRNLGEAMQKVLTPGCLSLTDWRLVSDKTIGAGEGIVNDCYCQTIASTDITSLLTNGATNYVYLTINSSTSPTDGVIVAQATVTAGAAPDTACKLGSITLDGAGAVTAVDNDDEDFLRDYAIPLRWRRVQFDEVIEVTLGEYADLEVDHSGDVDFTIPTTPKITSIDDGVRAELLLNATDGGKFTLRLHNDGDYTVGTGYDTGYGTLTQVRVVGERWGI